MGDASYTLIDDDGVEFYLSPKDKKIRKRQGLDDLPKKRVTILEDGDEEDKSEKRKVPLQNDFISCFFIFMTVFLNNCYIYTCRVDDQFHPRFIFEQNFKFDFLRNNTEELKYTK